MRIAYLSTFYPFRGGIAQFNASLYRAMEKDHEVKAFTFTRQYPNLLFPGETQYVTDADNVDAIPSTEILDTINPFSYSKTARAINDFAPDLLIMKYWMSFFGPSLGNVASKMKSDTKVVTILDNVIPHEKRMLDTPFLKYFLKQNDGYIAMSNSVREDLVLMSASDPKVILLEHPYYDHFGAKIPMQEARESLKLDPTKKTILYFGFIRDYKGLDLLIEAFGQLDDSYQLVLAGECYGSFDKYQHLIDKSPLKGDIHVHNTYISDAEVPNYFCAADVCVLPYKSATQSGITSISFHFDLPIIATDVGGLKESIHHEKNGLIVSATTPQAIGNSIQQYFDKDLKNQFIGDIQASKNEKSWANFGEKILKFSQEL
ncbi:MAG: glycosyltransferase [Flavobacteriales bacterium]|nr:glycosyltransferase [Flavobacteriales bacterium]